MNSADVRLPAPAAINGNGGNAVAVAIIGVLFFVFGFVTWLNGSLIPFLRIVCRLTAGQALLVTFAFYIAYSVMALPMAAILRRTGYRHGMALGMGIMAAGALLHIPAAYQASFALFLIALFTLGTGLTILQAASNPYIVLLGPIETAATRISIMGIINKSAGAIAPLVFAALVASDLGDVHVLAQHALSDAEVHALAAGLAGPYLGMTATLIVLAVLIRLAPLPEVEAPSETEGGGDETSILRFPHLVLGAITLFAYMGLEVIAGDTIGLLGQSLGVARFVTLTSYTMGFMVLGYVAGIVLIPRMLSQPRALALSGLAGLVCVAGAILSSPGSHAITDRLWGWTGAATIPDPVVFVALMGLANALVWPTVWPLALQGLGRFTATGSALLIMAISGGALIPQLFGWLAGATGNLQVAYVVAAPCYLMILFYALRGHRVRHW